MILMFIQCNHVLIHWQARPVTGSTTKRRQDQKRRSAPFSVHVMKLAKLFCVISIEKNFPWNKGFKVLKHFIGWFKINNSLFIFII